MCQCDAGGGVVVDRNGSFARGAWREASSAFAERVARLGPAAAGAKRCCRCDVDVTGVRRMRDRQGRYWCYACGKADSERKHGAAARIPCPLCGRACRRDRMVQVRGMHLCDRCGYRRDRDSVSCDTTDNAGAAHARDRRLRLLQGTVAMIVLATISMYRWGVFESMGLFVD